MKHQRIDGETNIVDPGPGHDGDVAGIGIDLDLADMSAIGKAAGLIEDLAGGLQIFPRATARRSMEAPPAVKAPSLWRSSPGATWSTGAASSMPFASRASTAWRKAMLTERIERPECEPPPAETLSLSLAMKRGYSLERDVQPLRSKLAEGRLMALAAAHGPHYELDATVVANLQLGALAREPAGDLDVVGDGDAPACRAPRLRLGGRQSWPQSASSESRGPWTGHSRRCRR